MVEFHSTSPRHPWGANYFTDLNHESLGWYFSGLADGEAYFQLNPNSSKCKRKRPPRTEFNLSMRDDDKAVLERLLEFWGCGFLYAYDPALIGSKDGMNRKPMIRYVVNRAADCAKIVVPHFRRFPLLAKKARDFAVWEQGVELAYSVQQRRGSRKWFDSEIKRFVALSEAMKAQRKYHGVAVELPPPKKPHRTLYD